ncbi:MAG TPA: DDE-type integrase/transposase/recombinase [Acidobacteriaceae bacterium]
MMWWSRIIATSNTGFDQCVGFKRFEPATIRNPTYPAAISALKREGILSRRVRLRQCKYLNNIVEQDHRSVKKRMWLANGYGSFQSAWRTLEGIETAASAW